jgi:hypothetical protein
MRPVARRNNRESVRVYRHKGVMASPANRIRPIFFISTRKCVMAVTDMYDFSQIVTAVTWKIRAQGHI